VAIHVKDLTKNYKTYERGNTFKEVVTSLLARKAKLIPALKGISFDVEPGELVGFIGPNGAGKSTTIKILSGTLYPSRGEVTVLGHVPWKERKKCVANIGVIFGQKSQLIWDIPPLDSFHLNKAIYNIPDAPFKATLRQMTELLEVQRVIRQPTRQLSLGERMKCEFIMAMLHQPKIVFLDEPTIGLDVIAKDRIREFILEMNQKGVTFILTTHDLDDIEHLARRVIVINHGEIVFDDALDALRKYFGSKKTLCLSTRLPLPELNIPGLTVTRMVSAYEAELELDTARLELYRFIREMNDSSGIYDLSIQELPIEEVIKEMYMQDEITAPSA
jgi:ABC-2 type transport system ATP-binding protein